MPKKYRIQYLPIAEEDLVQIFEYIYIDNPEAAARFVERMDTATKKLESFPRTGPIPNDNRLKLLGYRMLVIDNYIVFYVLIKDVVEIRRIVHGKRRYSFLLE